MPPESSSADNLLAEQLGPEIVDRGRAYLRDGRVLSDQQSGQLTMATVAGSGRHPYQVLVAVAPDGLLLHQGCSCPMSGGCKHVAAVALSVLHRQRDSWRDELEDLLSEPVEVPQLGLRFDPDGHRGTDRITLTPVIRGRLGNWVRTGISWADLRHPHHRVAAHPGAGTLNGIRQLLSATSWYDHATVLLNDDPIVWRMLRSLADDHGVSLVWGKRGIVSLAEQELQLGVDLSADPDGSVVLQPGIADPEPSDSDDLRDSVDLIGDPPFAGLRVRDDRATLWRVDGAQAPLLRHLLQRPGPLRVPAAEAQSFRVKYLPRIRRQNAVTSIDQSVPLPPEPEPALELTLSHHGGHRISLRWGFRYRAPGVDFLVGLAAGPDDPVARDSPAEAAALRALQRPDLQLPKAAGGWIAETADLADWPAIDFVTGALPVLAELGVRVVVVGDLPDYRSSTTDPVVEIGVSETPDPDWFNLELSVRIDDREAPLGLLMQAIGRSDPLVLPDGLIIDISHERFDQLRQLMSQAKQLEDPQTGELKISPQQLGLYEQLVALGIVGEQSAAWTERVERLLQRSTIPPPQPPSSLRAELRPYQHDGYAWLVALIESGLGGVLADDMGLGKTVQALAAVQHARDGGEQRPVLVVAPTSVVGGWVAEAQRFTPDLSVTPIESTRRRRGTDLSELAARADVVVTSYALLRLEIEAYVAIGWSVVLLDEAQVVKNHRAKGYQCVRRLRADSKIAISGTPMENHLLELWSMMSICAPGLFASPDQFAAHYQRPIERDHNNDRLTELRARIRPFLLRRTKQEVATELPPRIEQVVTIDLAPAHRRAYQLRLTKERQRVLGLLDHPNRNRVEIFAALTRLRQLALSPGLIDDGLDGVPSAKIDALVVRLRELADEGHRALVFSQFTRFLTAVADRLRTEGIEYVYLDGRTKDRARVVDEFRSGQAPAFLISLKAGGVGLNLTEADYCFLLDPWWNPATEAQAIDRTHRIGQQRPVMVYRMISADTIEERVLALQQAKRDLFGKVIGTQIGAATGLNAADLRGLLDP